jgi:hypothetical protein
LPDNSTLAYSGPALVELMGRRQVAGYVSPAVIGAGLPALRVDVPAVDGQPAHTSFYTEIYGLHPLGEAEMVAMVKVVRHRPVESCRLTPWRLAAAAVTAGPDYEDEECPF